MATNPDDPSGSGFWDNEWHQGLTKREEFAKAAMMGLLCKVGLNEAPGSLADYAKRYADALIAELNKEAKP